MNAKQCLDLLSEQEYHVTNSTWSNRSIYFQPILMMPWIFYLKYNNSGTEKEMAQVCGPLLQVVLEYAKKTNSKLKMKRMPTSKSDFIAGLIFEGEPDIIATPWSSVQLESYIAQFHQAGFNYRMSRCGGWLEMASIVSRVRPGKSPKFMYFTCISWKTQLAMSMSIMLISTLLTFIRKSNSSDFFECFWNFTIVIFARSLQKFIIQSKGMTRYMMGIWMLSSLIISTQYNSFLLDYMTHTNPVLRINSLQDVADRPDMTLLATNDSALFGYTFLEEPDQLALALRHKVKAYNAEGWLDNNFLRKLIQWLKTGSYAYSFYKMTAIFQIFRLTLLQSSDDHEKFIDIMHISKESGGYLPWAMAVNADKELVYDGINRMIAILQESGIFDHWVMSHMMSNAMWIGRQNPLVINMYAVVRDNPVEYQVLTSDHFKDLFYLLGFAMFSTFVINFIENIFHLSTDKNSKR